MSRLFFLSGISILLVGLSAAFLGHYGFADKFVLTSYLSIVLGTLSYVKEV